MGINENEITKYIVHAFQVHQEPVEIEDEIDVVYHERSFPVGSIFNFSVQSSPSSSLIPSSGMTNDDWSLNANPASIHIAHGTQLSIDTIALDPSIRQMGNRSSLFIATDVNPQYTCICPHISLNVNYFITSLGISAIGPSTIKFILLNHHDDDEDKDKHENEEEQIYFNFVNIFGKVSIVPESVQQLVLNAKENIFSEEDNNLKNDTVANNEEKECGIIVKDKRSNEMSTGTSVEISSVAVEKVTDEEEKDKSKEETSTCKKNGSSTGENNNQGASKRKKKRKLSEEKQSLETLENSSPAELKDQQMTSEDNSNTTKKITPPQKLTKKQRRHLAKKKTKELEDAIALENNHVVHVKSSNEFSNEGKKTQSLTKPRLLSGGVLVQDIVRGHGQTSKMGRKVSINYVGEFPKSGEVFDKNMRKSSPMTFRIGTGQVIKGLDIGLEGMRVGGERVVTIPSNLGYGSKGSGDKIPPNADLCFTIHLRSIGNK